MKTPKLSEDGLTIVELLIVFLIMGILTAIGITSYISAKNKENKSKAQSVVVQIKSKLDQYYIDKNSYPATKDELTKYLNDSKLWAVANDFNAVGNPYSYAGSAAENESCTQAANDCTTYTLTAYKTYWRGGGDEADIVYKP